MSGFCLPIQPCGDGQSLLDDLFVDTIPDRRHKDLHHCNNSSFIRMQFPDWRRRGNRFSILFHAEQMQAQGFLCIGQSSFRVLGAGQTAGQIRELNRDAISVIIEKCWINIVVWICRHLSFPPFIPRFKPRSPNTERAKTTGSLKYDSSLPPNAFQRSNGNILDWVGKRDFPWFCRVFELMMVPNTGNFIPSICRQNLQDFPGGITSQKITSLPNFILARIITRVNRHCAFQMFKNPTKNDFPPIQK